MNSFPCVIMMGYAFFILNTFFKSPRILLLRYPLPCEASLCRTNPETPVSGNQT